jgi:hypothetical protein
MKRSLPAVAPHQGLPATSDQPSTSTKKISLNGRAWYTCALELIADSNPTSREVRKVPQIQTLDITDSTPPVADRSATPYNTGSVRSR